MPKRTPKKPVIHSPKDLLLKALKDARGELVSSRELKERIGPGWKDALAQLRAEGVNVEEAIGASHNRSFRLAEEQPPAPQYLTEPMPLPIAKPRKSDEISATVSLKGRDIRLLLRNPNCSDDARDVLAEALAVLQRRYDGT